MGQSYNVGAVGAGLGMKTSAARSTTCTSTWETKTFWMYLLIALIVPNGWELQQRGFAPLPANIITQR